MAERGLTDSLFAAVPDGVEPDSLPTDPVGRVVGWRDEAVSPAVRAFLACVWF